MIRKTQLNDEEEEEEEAGTILWSIHTHTYIDKKYCKRKL